MINLKCRLQYKAYVYVKHFYPEGITLDRHTVLKRYLFNTLIYNKRNDKESQTVLNTYKYTIDICAKEWHFNSRGLKGIYASANIDFNDMLVQLFDDLFFDFMTKNLLKSNRLQTSILMFQVKYKIDEEELSFETLKKAYYRYRQKDELFPTQIKKQNRKNYKKIDVYENKFKIEFIQNNQLCMSSNI